MIDLLQWIHSFELLGWVGSGLAIAGALLVALNVECSRFGFVCNLISSACLIGYALQLSAIPILLLNGVMVLVSLIGLFRWFDPRGRRQRWQRIEFDAPRYGRMIANARARQGL